jgi:hypothetical protein
MSVGVISIVLCLGLALPCLGAVRAIDPPPTVILFDPAFDDLTVQVNGLVIWGTHTPDKIWWDWGDQDPVVWEEGYFVNIHEYQDYDEYTISVKAQFISESIVQYSEIVQVTVNLDGSSSGYSLTIDNSNGLGSVFYRTSLTPIGDIVGSENTVTLYLALEDVVWDIFATPDEGYSFAYWDVDSSIIRDGYDFNEMSNPIDIIALIDDQVITPIFKETTILSVYCDPTSFDKNNPSQSLIEISGSLTNYFEDPLPDMDVELSYEGLTTHVQGTIGSATTDGNGEFSYSWSPNPDLPNDEYRLTAFMVGDDYYAPSTATTGIGGVSNLFVVPEYTLGAILAIFACFAAFFAVKKPWINLKLK